MTGFVLLAADQQLPEDVGKAGPIGALLTVLLFLAILLLVRSMTTHLKRVPRSFDAGDDGPQVIVPDTPAELVDPRPEPGQELLDTLRRAPRAIEAPRRDDDRPGPAGG
ncbi:hypothetical protein SAMN05660350_01315 [Geodermatophilus obscurus]|jgi:hypothetical protein|uniref:Uncharacterized protein n=1 Tax=Geodermatophilus obscurus TaxID=1861 RepID=A0A1M7T3I0_9ACTN|nr:hypothetical protein [Geodermatophilus obscurus]SHN65237.1 hypothetical protein SAMN05660350_01315 [Geodermatophilus obscurus]